MYNDSLPYVGILLVLFGWVSRRVNTYPITANISFILQGGIWVFLYLADLNPAFQPTWGSTTARTLMILYFIFILLHLGEKQHDK